MKGCKNDMSRNANASAHKDILERLVDGFVFAPYLLLQWPRTLLDLQEWELRGSSRFVVQARRPGNLVAAPTGAREAPPEESRASFAERGVEAWVVAHKKSYRALGAQAA